MATVTFTLDGKMVTADSSRNLLDIARDEGAAIPSLCYLPRSGYKAAGNCRSCMVEIKGERVLAASCIRKPAEGMVVTTANARVESARKTVIELLLSNQPKSEYTRNDELTTWASAVKAERE